MWGGGGGGEEPPTLTHRYAPVQGQCNIQICGI